MTDPLTDSVWILWLGIVLVLIVVEMVRLDFRALLGSVAALAALLTGLLGAPWWLQALVVAVAAPVLLLVVRPALLRALPVEDAPDPEPSAPDDAPLS